MPTTPGTIIAYAERTFDWSTNNSTIYDTAIQSLVAGCTFTLTGEGKMVDIVFRAPLVSHPTADYVVLYLIVNELATGKGGAFTVNQTMVKGMSMRLERSLVLTTGTSYTFKIGAQQSTSSGRTLFAATATYPIEFFAVAR